MNNDINFSISNDNLDFNKVNINSSIYKIPLSGTWWKIAISGNSQYQLAIQNSLNGQCFLSIDYGINWKTTNNNIIGYLRGVSMSKDGKYQTYLEQSGPISISSNYGNTWKNIELCANKDISGDLIINSTIKNWYSISSSASGLYQTAVSFNDDPDNGGFIFITKSYGDTWEDKTPYIRTMPGFYYGISLSYTGRIQLIAITTNNISNGDLYLSSYIISYDYGDTWSDSILLGQNLVNCVINQSIDETIDGKYQYLIDSGGNGIYRSNNFGQTWDLVYANNSDWRTICISDSGKYVYACTRSNYIGISDDYGNTWKNVYFNISISGISTSSDGSIVTVTSLKNKIYISTDYGNNFNDNNNSPIYKNINDIQISTNGSLQVASITNDRILISTNYGKIWKEIEQKRTWSQNAMSLTGEYQTVCELNGYCYISSDYGNTWQPTENLKLTNISYISMSGDGKYQIICNGTVVQSTDPCIYMSYNYGRNWVPIIISTVRRLIVSRMSLNGQYILLLDNLGEQFSSGESYLSNNYGITFNKLQLTNAIYSTYTACMSSLGQYINIIDDVKFRYTTDYGNTWKTKYFSEMDIIKQYPNYIGTKGAISSTGQFQYITLNSSTNNIVIYSFDYGNTWQILNTELIINNIGVTSLSSNGQYLACSNQNTVYNIYLNILLQ